MFYFVCIGVSGDQKKASDSLELNGLATTWVPGIEPSSSGIATSVLKLWAISPAPTLAFFWFKASLLILQQSFCLLVLVLSLPNHTHMEFNFIPPVILSFWYAWYQSFELTTANANVFEFESTTASHDICLAFSHLTQPRLHPCLFWIVWIFFLPILHI